MPIRLNQAECGCCVRLALTGGKMQGEKLPGKRAGWSKTVIKPAWKRVTGSGVKRVKRETGLRLRLRRQVVTMSRADGR